MRKLELVLSFRGLLDPSRREVVDVAGEEDVQGQPVTAQMSGRRLRGHGPSGVVNDDLSLAEDLVLAVGTDEDRRRLLDSHADERRILEDDG